MSPKKSKQESIFKSFTSNNVAISTAIKCHYNSSSIYRTINQIFFFVFVHIYPPFTRKRIVSLYFGRDLRTRLGVAIFEVSGPSVFHIKTEASR